MRPGGQATNYALFLLLSLFLGTSYAWTKLGLAGLDPLTFVLLRLLIGASVLAVWLRAAGEHVPRNPVILRQLAVLGAINVLGAFVLLTWGQQFVASSQAAILVAAGPIFSSVGAALVLPDEGLDVRRFVALAVGFVGVSTLFVGDLGEGPAGGSGVQAAAGAIAVVTGAVIVASVAIAVRLRVHGLSPVQIVLPQLLAGVVVIGVLTATVRVAGIGSSRFDPWSWSVVAALLALGVLNAGVGNLVYYRLILTWGVSRTALVGYVAPFVGAAVGAYFLGEEFGATLLIGLVLITISLAVVNAAGPTLPVSDPVDVLGVGGGATPIERRQQ